MLCVNFQCSISIAGTTSPSCSLSLSIFKYCLWKNKIIFYFYSSFLLLNLFCLGFGFLYRRLPSAPRAVSIQFFLSWTESDSPGCYYFCVRQFMQLSLFRPHYCFFAFSSPGQDGKKCVYRKIRRENETKKEQITWAAMHRKLHELPCTEMVKSGTIRLTSGLGNI